MTKTTNSFEETIINNWIETTQRAYNGSDLQVYDDDDRIIVESPKSSSTETYDFTFKDIAAIEYAKHLTTSDSFEGNHYITVEKVKSDMAYTIEDNINENGYDFIQDWLSNDRGEYLIDRDWETVI